MHARPGIGSEGSNVTQDWVDLGSLADCVAVVVHNEPVGWSRGIERVDEYRAYVDPHVAHLEVVSLDPPRPLDDGPSTRNKGRVGAVILRHTRTYDTNALAG